MDLKVKCKSINSLEKKQKRKTSGYRALQRRINILYLVKYSVS